MTVSLTHFHSVTFLVTQTGSQVSGLTSCTWTWRVTGTERDTVVGTCSVYDCDCLVVVVTGTFSVYWYGTCFWTVLYTVRVCFVGTVTGTVTLYWYGTCFCTLTV